MFTNKIKTAAMAAIVLTICVSGIASQSSVPDYYESDDYTDYGPISAKDFEYDLDSKGTGVLIKKYIGKVANVEIPATIEDFPVTEIGWQAFYRCGVKSVTIPKGVTTIGAAAFAWCGKLTSITIPKGITTIGDSAFYWCTTLTSVTIPEGVTTIGNSAFYRCTALKSVTIQEGVTTIGKEAFSLCNALTSTKIPASVKKIESAAFANCKSLTTVEFGSEETVVYPTAFDGCDSLPLKVKAEIRKHPIEEMKLAPKAYW